jgi:hypothetical protein
MSYRWDGAKGILYCENGVEISSLPLPSGEYPTYELKKGNQSISIKIEHQNKNNIDKTVIIKVGDAVNYPVSRSDKFMINAYYFRNKSEKSEVIGQFLSAMKHMMPDNYCIDISDELKEELGV